MVWYSEMTLIRCLMQGSPSALSLSRIPLVIIQYLGFSPRSSPAFIWRFIWLHWFQCAKWKFLSDVDEYLISNTTLALQEQKELLFLSHLRYIEWNSTCIVVSCTNIHPAALGRRNDAVARAALPPSNHRSCRSHRCYTIRVISCTSYHRILVSVG